MEPFLVDTAVLDLESSQKFWCPWKSLSVETCQEKSFKINFDPLLNRNLLVTANETCRVRLYWAAYCYEGWFHILLLC